MVFKYSLNTISLHHFARMHKYQKGLYQPLTLTRAIEMDKFCWIVDRLQPEVL